MVKMLTQLILNVAYLIILMYACTSQEISYLKCPIQIPPEVKILCTGGK